MRIRLLSAAALAALMTVLASSAVAKSDQHFIAHLSGAEESTPNASRARGIAIFHVINDGEAIVYRLNVANLENAVAAHIHVGAPGVDGPVVVQLYGPEPPAGGRLSGSIASGVITGDDLLGPLAGSTLEALITQIEAGNTYVNVHTNDGVPPANTGPGDLAAGEIRGQIQ